MSKIAEGRKGPDFTLEDAGGRRVSLADFKGKDVIVYFYPKDDTPGCTKEACGFRDLWQDLQKAGIVVLGVSADSPESHTKFSGKYRLPFLLLSDPERRVMTVWGAYGEKVLYRDHRSDPLDRLDRPRRDRPEALGASGRRGQASRPGPRSRSPRGRVRRPPAPPGPLLTCEMLGERSRTAHT
jgi:thioredoxin-dependent peroxiredoxin